MEEIDSREINKERLFEFLVMQMADKVPPKAKLTNSVPTSHQAKHQTFS